MVIGAVGGGILALVGLVLYLFVLHTDLELWAGTTILSVAVLARAIVERNPRLVWPAAVTAALAAGQLLGAFATHAGWPSGDRHVITSAGGWLRWAGLASLVVLLTSELRPWLSRRSDPPAQDSADYG